MGAIAHFFESLNSHLSAFFASLSVHFISLCERFAYPVLSKFFLPINNFLAPIYQPYATITAITFFVGTMLWVGLYLREGYVNRGRPKRTWYTDLRIWTVVSMLPHVFVYFYFY